MAAFPATVSAAGPADAPAWASPQAALDVPLFGATRAAAREREIAVETIAPPVDGPPAAGDTLTAIVTLRDRKQSKQWLVQLTSAELNERERSLPPIPETTLYSSSGNELHFSAAPAVVELRTVGPFLDDTSAGRRRTPKIRDQNGRAVVNGEFLRLGFAAACESLALIKRARENSLVADSEAFSVTGLPPTAEQLAAGKKFAVAAGLSLEDEQAVAGVVPALVAFFGVVSSAPGLREILWEAVQRPSWWSIIRRAGRFEAGFTFHSRGLAPLDAAAWHLPGALPTWQLPYTFSLNDEPALTCTLALTVPDPPLRTSAGIVGLVAQRPDHADPQLLVRLLAARRGAAAPAP